MRMRRTLGRAAQHRGLRPTLGMRSPRSGARCGARNALEGKMDPPGRQNDPSHLQRATSPREQQLCEQKEAFGCAVRGRPARTSARRAGV